MSLGAAMASAVSGLTARSRGTALVANNISNLDTPGYSRRELIQNSSVLGGVRVDGVERAVNSALLIEKRRAEASNSEITARTQFYQRVERAIGTPEFAGGLSEKVTEFQASLINATEGPHTESELIQIANAAKAVTNKLNEASKAIQAERTKADAEIGKDVKKINNALERIVRLNRLIAVSTNSGDDPSTHMDHRQLAIDELNSIVPVQVIPRSFNRVAIFTSQGSALLDGTVPTKVEYNPTGHLTPELKVGDNPGETLLRRLTIDGQELTKGQMESFAGGSLGAHFQVRDALGPEVQEELDLIALELVIRFSDPDTDPSISTAGAGVADNQKGLFVYDGEKPTPAPDQGVTSADGTNNGYKGYEGLAGRIKINALVDPDGDHQEFRRLRDGILSDSVGLKGDTAQLNRFEAVLRSQAGSPNKDVFAGEESLIERLTDFESRIGTRRVSSESLMTTSNSQLEVITHSFLSDGVDQDAETQKLLQLERSFAANARVVQAVDDMLAEILRW